MGGFPASGVGGCDVQKRLQSIAVFGRWSSAGSLNSLSLVINDCQGSREKQALTSDSVFLTLRLLENQGRSAE